MIEARNIVKRYGDLEVLQGVDIDIAQGEIVSIVGPSGAGKTTLLHIIGTLDTPQQGEVRYDGQNVLALKDRELAHFRNRNIGFVFQFHQLLPEFTMLENVAIPALLGGDNRADAMNRAKRLLERMHLGDRMSHKPSQLSGGECQRVAVARALINSPRSSSPMSPRAVSTAKTSRNCTVCSLSCATSWDRLLLLSPTTRG